MLNREQELWACALWIEKTHGDRGPAHIGDQAARMALKGDEAGIATWLAIADRYDALMEGDAPALY